MVFGYGTGSTGGKFIIAMNNGHELFSNWGGSVIGTNMLNDGNWHFIAFVVDPNGVGATPGNPLCSWYFDGKFDSSGLPLYGVNTTLSSAYIGTYPSLNRWAGELDELALFTNALSGATIQSLYYAAKDLRRGTVFGMR